MTDLLLEVSGLKMWIGNSSQPLKAVDGIDFKIHRGETFALLGESGCGKSMSALSLLRLQPSPAGRIIDGTVELYRDDKSQSLLTLSEAELQQIRGRRIAMIFQEPQSSLNPVLTVAQQIGEPLQLHFNLKGAVLRDRILELLNAVGIPDPEQRLQEYPHQLSGGMKQRIMIAMALAGEPELLIADEPTTALDVTIQAQILDLLKQLQQQRGMAILLISHDLGVVSQMADHVAVMYAGQLIEMATREQFFNHHKHPYTAKLFEALPSAVKREQRLTIIKGSVPSLKKDFSGCRFADRCDSAWDVCHQKIPEWSNTVEGQRVRCHLYDPAFSADKSLHIQAESSSPLSEVISAERKLLGLSDLKVYFPIKKGFFQRTVGQVKAVDGVSFEIKQAETLALVGESGCGKTTVGKGILQLVTVTSGTIYYDDEILNKLTKRELRARRSELQIIFQDPFSAMNPRMMVSQIIEEGMLALGVEKDASIRQQRVEELLTRVGLRPEHSNRYPHEFSGGQRQRICIARALAVNPKLIICDEPTSALDVSVQAQILNLLREIQHEFGLSYLFITHNIAVVDYFAHRVAVMYLGRIVEQGSREDVLNNPKHPYTQALLSAVPELDKDRQREIIRLEGELPSPANPPAGCHFHQRCPKVMSKCAESYPEVTDISATHQVNCFLFNSEDNNGSTD